MTFKTLVLFCIIFSYQLLYAQVSNSAWELVKKEDGITVYTRTVPGYVLKEFKGSIYLQTSIQHMVKILKNVRAFPQWMPTVRKVKFLESKANEQIHYIENKTPWPLSNRDGVYHFDFQKKRKKGVDYIVIKVQAKPNYMPPRENLVRITKADGSWTFWPQNNGVVVTYQMHADPEGSIPKWLINKTVVDTPYKTLKRLRLYLKK